jgi:hypothetical protein
MAAPMPPQNLIAEKAQLQAALDRANGERARHARELADLKRRQAEETRAPERVDNVTLRECVNDIGAEKGPASGIWPTAANSWRLRAVFPYRQRCDDGDVILLDDRVIEFSLCVRSELNLALDDCIHNDTRVMWRALIFGQFSTMVLVPCQASRAGVFKRMLLRAGCQR